MLDGNVGNCFFFLTVGIGLVLTYFVRNYSTGERKKVKNHLLLQETRLFMKTFLSGLDQQALQAFSKSFFGFDSNIFRLFSGQVCT